MKFDDYILKQDHVLVMYYDKKPLKRFLSLDGMDIEDVESMVYLKYDIESKDLMPCRENGPSHIGYYANGAIRFKIWHQGGIKHRLNGPAIIDFNRSGDVIKKEYYVNGNFCLESNYLELGGAL